MSEAVRREVDALSRRTLEAWTRTQTILRVMFGEKRTLQFMSLTDRRRLITFLIWEDRYKVSLEWMAEHLLEHYEAKRKREITGKRRRVSGLPVRAATLVGETSRLLIEQAIALEFPNDEHKAIWRERTQHQFARREEPELEIQKPYLYNSLEEYDRRYRRMVMESRNAWAKLRRNRKRTGLPYRNSPWR